MSKYAPEYTRKERTIIVLKASAWAVPLYAFFQFWFFDWLGQYSDTAHCQQYGSVNGAHLVFYGLFVALPLLIGIVVFLLEGRRSLQVLKLGQSPLPYEKVFKPTKYTYGCRAKVRPTITLLLTAYCVCLAVWGGFQAHSLTMEIKPCTVNQSPKPT